jgi:hypothetical protein
MRCQTGYFRGAAFFLLALFADSLCSEPLREDFP